LLKKWYSNKTLAISTISIAEFLTKSDIEDQKKFNNLLYSIETLPVSIDIAKQAAIYRKQFSRKVKRVHMLDCMLAATAKIHKCTLVTTNLKDFPMKDIKILDPGA